MKLPTEVTRAFGRMAIAEDEIAAAVERHPDRVKAINDAFLILRPSELLSGKAEIVYRYHVRELLERVARRIDPAPGTDAEVMCALAATSLKAPLQHDAAAAYSRIFEAVFGETFGEFSESYPGAADEVISDARRKLTTITRRRPPPRRPRTRR